MLGFMYFVLALLIFGTGLALLFNLYNWQVTKRASYRGFTGNSMSISAIICMGIAGTMILVGVAGILLVIFGVLP